MGMGNGRYLGTEYELSGWKSELRYVREMYDDTIEYSVLTVLSRRQRELVRCAESPESSQSSPVLHDNLQGNLKEQSRSGDCGDPPELIELYGNNLETDC